MPARRPAGPGSLDSVEGGVARAAPRCSDGSRQVNCLPMIPAEGHFVWIGPALPWAYVWAIRSAALASDLDLITLHHTDELQSGPGLELLGDTPRVCLQRIDPLEWMREVGDELGLGAALTELYRRVEHPVARSNVLRAAVLHARGGIYLDLDTVTIRSLRALLEDRQFLGHEHIVWPGFVRRSSSRWLKLRSLTLSTVRDGLRRWPGGYRYFRSIAGWYYHGINGAVAGAEAGAPLMAQYLAAMVAQPPDRQLAKHGLGTHLLQQQVEQYPGDDLKIHPPELFYPLPPEIAEHWFRTGRRPCLDLALHPATRIVHWYASAGAKPFLSVVSPAYVQQHATVQLYSALVARFAPTP